MSRSRPKQKSGQDSTPFGEGFPVGRSVCNCYLKKMTIKQKFHVDIPFHRIYLHFLHENSGKWITKFISVLPAEAFKTMEEYNEHKIQVAKSLENLMACYLSGSHIKHIMFQTHIAGIVLKFEQIHHALTEKQFWNKEVCLKTTPNKDGGVSVAKYTPYMSYPGNNNWTLAYSKWELDKVSQHK